MNMYQSDKPKKTQSIRQFIQQRKAKKARQAKRDSSGRGRR